MSKLNDLITKLCPDGVQYKKLGEIAVIKKGTQLNKSMLLDDGKYPVLNGGKGYSGYWNKYNFNGDRIAISQGGASAGFVTWMKKPFWAGAHCYVIDSSKESELRYLFHVIKSHELDYMKAQYGAGIPSLSLKTLSQTEIPLPPLPVREEIVRILDSFTELEAELTDRKEQYEYYRDHLLDKKNLERMDGKPIEMKKLRDVCSKTKTIKWGDSSDSRFYIDLSSVDMNTHKIGELEQITAENAPSRAKQVVKENDLLFATTRPTQMRCCVIPALLNNQICSTGYCVLRVKDASIDIRYVFHYLTTDKFKAYLGKNQTEGNYPAISDKKLREFQLPIPSLATQERVVDILDRFDTLTTSLTDGIPAEIAMRREQYEYYRSRLLDFPHLPDGSASVSAGE